MPIPWIQLVKLAPSILSMTGDLLRRSRKVEQPKETGTEGIAERIRALETELPRQAEALHAMARQVEGLTSVLASLRRVLWLAVTLGSLALLLSVAALLTVLNS